MELRHIRYFLAIAEEGNFTRAAARLGIGQPPLSLQIRDLEREIGVLLFHRVPHGAELTEAGRAFREAVRTIPEQAAEAARAARRAAAGQTGELSLGFIGSAPLNPLVPACIRAFRRAYPDVRLKLEEVNAAGLLAGLEDGRLDIAILRPAERDPDTVVERLLIREPMVVALPATHAAASGRGGFDLLALKDEPLILTPPAMGSSVHATAVDACRAAGFEPMLGQPAPQIASILSMVEAELGFSLVPACTRQLGVAGVVYRTIRPPQPMVGLAVAHRADHPSRPATNFMTLSMTTARRESATGPASGASSG